MQRIQGHSGPHAPRPRACSLPTLCPQGQTWLHQHRVTATWRTPLIPHWSQACFPPLPHPSPNSRLPGISFKINAKAAKGDKRQLGTAASHRVLPTNLTVTRSMARRPHTVHLSVTHRSQDLCTPGSQTYLMGHWDNFTPRPPTTLQHCWHAPARAPRGHGIFPVEEEAAAKTPAPQSPPRS